MSPTKTDQMAYLQRRMDEEKTKAANTSCIVRSVHRDFADAYRERIEIIAAAADRTSA